MRLTEPPLPTETRHWIVAGLVQGVGFRWFTYRQAHRYGLTGWVANLPDGRVEVVARGSPADLNRLEASLREGPRHGRVDSVEKVDYPHETGISKSFYIR